MVPKDNEQLLNNGISNRKTITVNCLKKYGPTIDTLVHLIPSNWHNYIYG